MSSHKKPCFAEVAANHPFKPHVLPEKKKEWGVSSFVSRVPPVVKTHSDILTKSHGIPGVINA